MLFTMVVTGGALSLVVKQAQRRQAVEGDLREVAELQRQRGASDKIAVMPATEATFDYAVPLNWDKNTATRTVAATLNLLDYAPEQMFRPRFLEDPKLGGRVEVWTRGPHRQVGSANIIEVGTQFETLPPALQMPARLANSELGLPLAISVPSSLKIRPGELVDLKLIPGPGAAP